VQAKRASSWKSNCGFPNSKSLFSGTDEPWTCREKREISGSGLKSGRTCHRPDVTEGKETPNGGGKRRRSKGWRLANDAKAWNARNNAKEGKNDRGTLDFSW
jgi:hypothetical protein